MVVRLGIVSLIVATSCFGPTLPAIDCGEGNFCPGGMVCRLPERICVDPGPLGDAGGDGDGATADAGFDAPPLPAMVDRGLLLRYFIDEAASGTMPTELVDSAPNPLPLPIDYGATANLAFVELDGHRALRWATAGGDGAPRLLINNTKIEDLDGREEATYEVVVDLSALGPVPFSRILNVGVSGSLGDGSLLSDSADALSIAYEDGSQRTTWPVDLFSGRLVIHTVFDSNLADGSDRLKLYVDGELVSGPSGSVPLPGGSIDLDPDGELLIGNNPLVRRCFRGAIHYVGVYTVALTEAEVATNAGRLAISDDRR